MTDEKKDNQEETTDHLEVLEDEPIKFEPKKEGLARIEELTKQIVANLNEAAAIAKKEGLSFTIDANDYCMSFSPYSGFEADGAWYNSSANC